MNHLKTLGTAAALVLAMAGQSHASNILISNDDGFETANIRALYEKLVAAGHSVIISAPTQNQSGQGGRVEFLRPMGPLAIASKYGSVPAGSPAVGVDPTDPNIHYVDGSPVMALLYGLDVLAQQTWGKAPDLIISGPNEGNNTGAVNPSSGTFANALYGINRGIPSIAVSDAVSSQRSFRTLVPGDRAYMVADKVITLIDKINSKSRAGKGYMMPPGVGLNVNIPAASCSAPGYALTEVSTATTALPVFFADISTSPLAAAFGLGNVHLPAVGVVLPGTPVPPGVTVPTDTNPKAEATVLASCKITISIINGVSDIANSNVKKLTAALMELPNE
jgi:5'-nucleotidase